MAGATHSKTQHATSLSSIKEDEEQDKLATMLREAAADLRKLDQKLIDQRKPVNETTAAIKGVYDRLEKQGVDRDLFAFLYKGKRKNRFTAQNLVILNTYSKALGEADLPLFEVTATKH